MDHSSNTSSIMYAYYNANYNLSNFANDPAVATFRSLYTNVSTSPWKDASDPTPGNGRVDVTYSFVPDGTGLDSRRSSDMFGAFNRIFGSATVWKGIFADALNRWAGVSNGKVAFSEHADTGLKIGFTGAAQNDSHAGDIRIGAHRFDGPSKVLAHTYFPPPNGGTTAGDSHYDDAENWVLASSTTQFAATTLTTSSTTPGASDEALRFAPSSNGNPFAQHSNAASDTSPCDDLLEAAA